MTIKMPHAVKPANSEERAAAFISGAGASSTASLPAAEPEAGKAVVNMRFDSALLKRIDRAAKGQGITRTAWLHVAASKALDE
jgi:hypothetical protein